MKQSKPFPADAPATPERWRPHPPDYRSHGTVSQFIRETICARGGSCTRVELESAIAEDGRWADRLGQKAFLSRILWTLRNYRDIRTESDLLIATAKTLRRTLSTPGL